MSFAHSAAEQRNAEDDARPLQILYIGDYDPAGVLIDVSLERELRRRLRGDIELKFTRIGINPDQIETYDLPEKPRKAGDKRSLQVKRTVEAEAMPAHVLRTLLCGAIEGLLPAGALEVAKVAEASERDYLRRLATVLDERGERWRETFIQPDKTGATDIRGDAVRADRPRPLAFVAQRTGAQGALSGRYAVSQGVEY